MSDLAALAPRLARPLSLPPDVDRTSIICEWLDIRRPHSDRLYLEWRTVDAKDDDPLCAFVGINPSAAGDEGSDATCGNAWAISRRAGFRRWAMLNLFSAPATEPPDLLGYPGRPGYAREVAHRLRGVDQAVAAWGALSGAIDKESPYFGRSSELRTLLRDRRDELLGLVGAPFPWWCIGRNQDGSPLHPSRVSRELEVVEWRRP